AHTTRRRSLICERQSKQGGCRRILLITRSSRRSRRDTARELGAIDGGAERNDASLLEIGRLRRLDALARHPRPHPMDGHPVRPVAVAGTKNALDPDIVRRQLGELVLELLEIHGAFYRHPHAVDSVSSVRVEMLTLLVGMVTKSAIWLRYCRSRRAIARPARQPNAQRADHGHVGTAIKP